jgi:outer membrane autotransporter protein
LINAGSLVAPGGRAIVTNFSGVTVTLLPGSFMVGAIIFTGAGNTLNVNTGNQNLTLFTLAGVTVGGSVPFVAVGNQVASVDPTPFGLADKTLMDFTRGISGLLDSMGGGAGPSGPMSSAFAPSAPDSMAARVEETFTAIPALAYANDQPMAFKAPAVVASDGRAIWARGFGGERTQDPDGGLLGAHTSFFGGAVGFDLLARPDLRIGLFAGGGESRMSLDANQGHTDTDTAFGGLYGRWGFMSFGHASFVDFALHGGSSTNSTSRTVNNNTLPAGLEIATASYNSSYVSPEIKYGVNVPLWGEYTLTPSLRLRYVAGFFGGYTESGTTAPLAVASRTIQDLEERGEVKLTRATRVGSDLLLTSVYVGAIGLERLGDTTVNTVLLGAGLPFVAPGQNTTAGIVGGGGMEWRTRAGVSFFGAAEAIGFTDQSTVWGAKGGVRVAF